MARILVVTNTPHSPATSGYSQRVSAVIDALKQRGHTVKALAIKPGPSSESAPASNQQSAHPSGHTHLHSRTAVLARLLRYPSLSAFKWYSTAACDALTDIVHKWNPEVVLLESSYLAPYRVLFSCPVVFDLHNIESQLIGNYAEDRHGLTAIAARIEARLLERSEASIVRAADGIATVSDADQETLRQLAQRYLAPRHRPARQLAYDGEAAEPPIITAPNGVTDEAFTVPDELSAEAAPTAVFIGHLGWRPNIDGAKWIANQVWPHVLARVPNAQLQLIGRDPAASVVALANPTAHVSVHGNVDSVFPYLARAAAATAPLWTAGGTRLKILEALATGTPVVATSLGALGLDSLADPQVLTISDSPDGFAESLAALLTAPAKSPAARTAATNFRWSSTLTGLGDMVESLV